MSQQLVSMAQQFSGLPMDSLIGGPLNAATNANNAMALTQTKFLLDTCFKKDDPEKDNYTPIMIVMSLSRGVLTPTDTSDHKNTTEIKTVTTKFNLPLLTIIPINSLAVDDIKIDFEMEVKSSYGEETSEKQSIKRSASGSFSAKIGFGCFSAKIQGSVSAKSHSESSKDTHYQKSNSAKYSVGIHAGQLPIPQGVATIIEAFSKAIDPIEMPSDKTVEPTTAPEEKTKE